jgi:hypothetical protein
MKNVKLNRIAESWSSESKVFIDVQWDTLRFFFKLNNISADENKFIVVDTPTVRNRSREESGPLSFGFSFIESASLKSQGIPCKGIQIVCHEPICIFTDGNNIALTAAVDGDNIVQILGTGSDMEAISSLIRIEVTGVSVAQKGVLPAAIVCEID